MRLVGIDCQIPSNKISNEEVVDLIKYYSSNYFSHNGTDLVSMVKKILNKTGIITRFWRAKHETPIEIITTATERALNLGGLKKNQVDMVIYSSIDRGFIEPANASFVCKAVGLNNTRCFDVVDACMGWCSSLQIANSFLQSDSTINSVMII